MRGGCGTREFGQVDESMRRTSVTSRLRTLVWATLACAVLAVVAPILITSRTADEPFSGYSVLASPRDLHVVSRPIRLSSAPALTLGKGVLYADGNAALGTPISRFVLDGPVFYLNVSGTRAAAEFEDTAENAGRASVAPLLDQFAAKSFDALTIRRGTLYVLTAAGASETISEIQAEVFASRKGQVTGKGSFLFRGQRLTFDTSLAPAAEKQERKLWLAKAAVRGPLIEAVLDGQMDATESIQVSGNAEIATPSLRKIAAWCGLSIPKADGLNAATLKGQLTWANGAIVAEKAKVTVDGNDASGALTVTYGGERPMIEGTLAFNALDLTPYVETLRSQSYVFDRQTWSWSAYDFTLPLLSAVDADLRLSASALSFKGHAGGGGAATITVRSGKLLANVVELDLPGGKASGRVTADVTGAVPRYALQGKIDQFDPSAITAKLMGVPALSGRSAVKFDLKSSGQTPAEVLRNLSGRAAIAVTEHAKLGLDVKALRTGAKTDAVALSQLARGSTSIDLLEAGVLFDNGVARSERAVARAGGLTASAEGTADLFDRTLELRVTVQGSDAADKSPRTVLIRGPWVSPSVRLEAAALPIH